MLYGEWHELGLRNIAAPEGAVDILLPPEESPQAVVGICSQKSPAREVRAKDNVCYRDHHIRGTARDAGSQSRAEGEVGWHMAGGVWCVGLGRDEEREVLSLGTHLSRCQKLGNQDNQK